MVLGAGVIGQESQEYHFFEREVGEMGGVLSVGRGGYSDASPETGRKVVTNR